MTARAADRMLKPGDCFEVREDAWPLNMSPDKIGEVEKAILDPVDGPIYLVWLGDELTTVYGWEVEPI